METRIETDTMGDVEVPAHAYYGAQTQRAVDNFPISGLHLPPEFVRAQALIKLAAAQSNIEAGRLDEKTGAAIMEAAREILAGQHIEQFVVDAFQAGAGTSQNMNMNEVLANRAAEILGGARGEYSLVHPNDHVNMGQSTNDTIHAAIHIAAARLAHDRLLPAARGLHAALARKADEFDDVVKIGRTHLQDATPIRLGQEFSGYAAMVERGAQRVEHALEAVYELCLGGSAVGTGLNTHPAYRRRTAEIISEETGHPFRPAQNPFEAQHAMDAVVELAGALRTLTISLGKIADDFRLLGSGPRCGIGELRLPPVQPGSSIMPGKVNPVLAEMLNMVCHHALGNDMAVTSAARASQLELNVMMPIVAYNLLQEMEILAGGMSAFNIKCVAGLAANEQACLRGAEASNALATALNPVIGYNRAAGLAKEALDRDRTVRELAAEQQVADPDTLEKLLDLRRMTTDPAEDEK